MNYIYSEFYNEWIPEDDYELMKNIIPDSYYES